LPELLIAEELLLFTEVRDASVFNDDSQDLNHALKLAQLS
jgi:hypothetical protein